MKLNLSSRKARAISLEARDNKKQETLKLRLSQVSASVRRKQVAQDMSAKKREPEKVAPQKGKAIKLVVVPETPPPPNRLKLKITRKVPVKNLTLNSAPLAKSSLPSNEELVWKGRRFNGKHLPPLQCNACSISRVCPKYKAGYECAYLPFLNSHKVSSVDDLVKYMRLMVGNSMKRVQLMSIIEAANGGMPSVEVSESMDAAFRQLKELHAVMSEKTEETVELEGDATVIGGIFGGMKLQKLVEETAQMRSDAMDSPLPEVPRAEGDALALPAADVSSDLVRDAILNAGPDKNNLKAPRTSEIVQTEIVK